VRRIRELGLRGRLVKGWTPPFVQVYRCDLTRVQQ
jgi:hypothetical protein